ncbi:hypothetical protein NLM59_07465 [Weeksellaceae bacterium KMM 9724]|uniref:hypothetical protein n=1 Tax=Profundicola chukchiensis TaxID=2961959 RepID=UPI00243B5A1C|nr:hypothetical protein [Profundicola chukchiensis]MDG4950759.1 hypothetical protein [Profundicola chukchiensis]
MKLFYHISTESYAPISHDNSYLFNHYDRVNNFIKTKLDAKYRNVLAKPVQRNYNIEWFSPYDGLQKHDAVEGEFALREYWKFKKTLDSFIQNLNVAQDKDAQNWADLLNKVFNAEDNIIFTNGKEISLIWGWKFEENNNYTPQILEPEPFVEEPIEVEEIEEPISIPEPIEEKFEPEPKEEELDLFLVEEVPVEDEPVEEEKGFLEFLKEFAANYWWLLIVLLSLIALIFIYYLIVSYS